jgi:enterochelin esterase family protein
MEPQSARRSPGRRAVLLLLATLALGAWPSIGATRTIDSRRPTGSLKEVQFDRELFGRTRRVWIYSWPDVPADSSGLLVVFDGGQYLDEIPLPRMLDSLIASGKIRPQVAVLIDNGSGAVRRGDLANRAAFAGWLGGQLVPWVRQHWTVSRDPRRAIVCGSSAGGLAAAYVALKRPDLFGNVLSQSGAFWRANENADGAPWEWLTGQYAAAPRAPIRFFLDVGSTETHGVLGGAGPPILDANRRLRDALRAKGYDVMYTEVPGGVHAPESWATRLPAGLVALAGPVR